MPYQYDWSKASTLAKRILATSAEAEAASSASGSLAVWSLPSAPSRTGRDDLKLLCADDARLCDWTRFWAKVDLMLDSPADAPDAATLGAWLGSSDGASSSSSSSEAASASAPMPAAPAAAVAGADAWHAEIEALEAERRELASRNSARIVALRRRSGADGEVSADASAKMPLASGSTALSLELTYRRMQAWKSVAHALRRGVCDKVPGFNRIEHEQASALPPSWLIRSGTRGKAPSSASGAADGASSGDHPSSPLAAAAAGLGAAAYAIGGDAAAQPAAQQAAVEAVVQAARQRLASSAALEPDDDTVCAVCFDGESTESNQIVFCDGCNIAIHQACYGIDAIPKNSYFCERCVEARIRERNSRRSTRTPRRPISCCLCPCVGGALKRTTDGRWAHIVCGLWLPAAKFVIQQKMGPIDVVGCAIAASGDAESPGACSVCNKGDGCVVRCTGAELGRCGRSFHPLCAWYAGYFMRAGERIATRAASASAAAAATELSRRNGRAELLLGTASICLQSFCPSCTPTAELSRGRSRQQQRRIRVKYRVLPSTADAAAAALTPLSRARARSRARRGALSDTSAMLEADCYRDGTCAVCFRAGGGDAVEDELQHCSSCGISVHAYCYTMRKGARARVGWWQCDSCADGEVDTDVVCALCPRRGGAFKRTTCGRWVHVTCAWWTPGVQLLPNSSSNASSSRALTKVRAKAGASAKGSSSVAINILCVSPRAFDRTQCYACGQQEGVTVQCAALSCQREFHPCCGFHNFHWMEAQASIAGGVIRKPYCHEHCPPGHVRDEATQSWRAQALPADLERALRVRSQLDHTCLLADLMHRREELKRQELIFERETFEVRLKELQKRRSEGIADLRRARLRDRSKAPPAGTAGSASSALPSWARLLIERGPRPDGASTSEPSDMDGEGDAAAGTDSGSGSGASSLAGVVGFESIVSALPILHAATEALRKLRVTTPLNEGDGDGDGGDGRSERNAKRGREKSSSGLPRLALDARLIQLLDAADVWLAEQQPQLKAGALAKVRALLDILIRTISFFPLRKTMSALSCLPSHTYSLFFVLHLSFSRYPPASSAARFRTKQASLPRCALS